jgi:hypothetical protein
MIQYIPQIANFNKENEDKPKKWGGFPENFQSHLIVDHHFPHKGTILGIDVMVDHQFVVTELPCSP